MKKLFAIICVLGGLNLAAVPLQWVCDWPEAKAQTFSLYQGETATFEPTFRVNGQVVSNATIAAVWYQTNGMGNAYWRLDNATFAPSNDVGAASYRFFVEATPQNSNAKLYRANGTLRMLPSPGFVPNVLPLPTQTLDFANVEVSNAPWLTEHQPLTNYYDKAETEAKIVELAPAPGDYANVSNKAMTALQPSATNALDASISSLVSQESQNSTNYTDDAISAYDESLGESLGGLAWQDDESDPVAMPAVRAVSNDVAVLVAALNGGNARFVVTNYNNAAHLGSATVEAKIDGEWLTVWNEMSRWNWFMGEYLSTNYYTKTEVDAYKADRSWGVYDPMTGDYAPEDTLWLSAPSISICAGASYQRVANAAGEYWVLTSNGTVTDINGVSSNGYFRISDSEGVTQFEIVKGDRQTLAAVPNSMTQSVMGVTHYFTVYAITNAVAAPTASFTRTLQPLDWYAEDDASCPCNVSWTQTGANEWTCEWWPKSSEPKMFMKAAYERGGETYIRNGAPVSMEYIILGGVKYSLGTATIDGHTVLTLTQTP